MLRAGSIFLLLVSGLAVQQMLQEQQRCSTEDNIDALYGELAGRQPKARVALLVLATLEVDPIAKHTLPLLEVYARHHGYDLLVQRNKLEPTLHVIWSKIRHLFEALKHYEAVAVFDNDVVITKYDTKIEDLLERHMNDPRMVMALPEDCALARCYSPGKPATWFILAKKAALEAVYAWLVNARDKCLHHANVHPFDQLVLWHCIAQLLNS